MTLHFGSVRLLPVTIFVLASLLAMKSVQLVRAAVPAVDAAQQAAPSAPQAGLGPPQPGPGAPPGPAKAAQPEPSPQATQDAAPPPISDAEKTVLLELRQRRKELDAREATLTARESLLAAAEQKLTARVVELQALQQKLEALETARQQREDASWQGLVKLYEAMKPRDAATIFNDLDMPVLLQVVDRMKEAKAAPVLAAMQPDKARDLTAKLAQMRTQRNGQPGS